VSVLGELLHEPLAPDVSDGRVMEDVDLPDPEAYLAISWEHAGAARFTYTVVVI
jgi:hypothetical protein